MRLLWLSLLSFLSVAFAGQIPIVDGVIGGVPKTTNKVKPAVLSNAAITPGKLRFKENSGICGESFLAIQCYFVCWIIKETTPGVNQVSGYGDVSSTKSLWFWFFESRSNPDTAPLALWFNGGVSHRSSQKTRISFWCIYSSQPGSSSMIGLLQELGPCRITNDSSHVTLNNFSWNNEANLLFIDQPVGVGFSHGDTTSVGTSQEAAADVWTFMQILFADPRFSKYQQNNLAIWTESWVWKYFWYIYSIEILFTDMEDTTDRHLLREFFSFSYPILLMSYLPLGVI